MGGVEAEGFGVHAGGGVVVVHDLHENAVVGVQGCAVGYVDGGVTLGVLNQQGSIAGVDLGAALEIDGVLALMGHKAKGIGIDDGFLVFLGLIGLGDLAVGVHQLIGFAGLQIGVSSGAAGEDGAVGANVHGNAQKLLVSGADHVGAVAGTLGEGVGIAVFILIGAVGLHDLIVAGEIHGGVDHVELHVGAGIRGQNGPAGSGGLAVNDVHGGVVALQIGATGSAHDAENPGGSHHGVLGGRVLIAVVEGAAVGVQGGVPDGEGGAGVGKQGHVGNAGYIDVGILYGELGALTEGGDGSALAGEVAGLETVAVGVKADGGLGDGVVNAACDDNAVKAGVGAVDGDVFSMGCVVNCILAQSLGDGFFVYHAVFVDEQGGMIGIVVVGLVSAACGKGGQAAGCIVQIVGVDHLGLVCVGIHRITAVKPGDFSVYQQGGLLTGRSGDIGSGTRIGGTGGSQRRGCQQRCAQSEAYGLGNVLHILLHNNSFLSEPD